MFLEREKLPTKCCKNVGLERLSFCDELAETWYYHNDDVCSYCKKHNYVCGEQVFPKEI